MSSASIQCGRRVKVAASAKNKDPWVDQKVGWEGVAVAPAANMESTHWQIRFLEPWCGLNILRVMPVASLVVIDDASDIEAEAPAWGAEEGAIEIEDSPIEGGNVDGPALSREGSGGDKDQDEQPESEAITAQGERGEGLRRGACRAGARRPRYRKKSGGRLRR
jgi:hypothetical protein